ncbi:MAG: orotidine-5'-phosphate decarboxylase [Steroidobacteraceae bacterium]
MSDFATRLAARIGRYGPLCVGIDPHAPLLQACGLPDSAEGALAFGQRIVRAIDFELAIVKPQSAFFERYGSAGIRALEQLMAEARARDLLVLLDGKRGDIDSTGEAYAEAYFRPGTPVRADALTWHVYLGFAALRRALEFAAREGGGAFIVVRSSNPEGATLQTAVLEGKTVSQRVCEEITAFNERLHPAAALGSIGAVVGATCDDAEATVAALPRSYILAPGVGAQGATVADIVRRMPSARGRVLPSVSRAIFANGANEPELRSALRAMRDEARRMWD